MKVNVYNISNLEIDMLPDVLDGVAVITFEIMHSKRYFAVHSLSWQLVACRTIVCMTAEAWQQASMHHFVITLPLWIRQQGHPVVQTQN